MGCCTVVRKPKTSSTEENPSSRYIYYFSWTDSCTKKYFSTVKILSSLKHLNLIQNITHIDPFLSLQFTHSRLQSNSTVAGCNFKCFNRIVLYFRLFRFLTEYFLLKLMWKPLNLLNFKWNYLNLASNRHCKYQS